MTKKNWSVFPYEQDEFDYPGTALAEHWDRLHHGDREPFPDVECLAGLLDTHEALREAEGVADLELDELAADLQEAWRAYHRGDFQEAYEQGLTLGPLGATVANKSAGIYANYLEEDEARALELYQEAAERAQDLVKLLPDACNAHYQRGYNLGRYSQGVSIAKALTQGVAGKAKNSFKRTLTLAPEHAEAHTALGMFHAEVVGQVGALVGGLTYGAKKETALEHFDRAIELHPESAIARMEYGNGLLLLYGERKIDEVTRLYEEAAGCDPVDAMECLDVEQAKAELE